MMTDEQKKDVNDVKEMLIKKISDIVEVSNKIPNGINQEAVISITYLKIFSAYLKEKKFESLEDAWKFMKDIKGIIEKCFYVNHYLIRLMESIEESKKTSK